MIEITLQLTTHDPIVARDGRPFGAGQGNRMRGLDWPLPSVVAGSFRTALVKANPSLDFTNDMPQRLMKIEVAGVLPTSDGELYLPAPNDAVAEPTEDGRTIKQVHRVTPQEPTEGRNFDGCDFPDSLPLQPVMLSEEQVDVGEDFKPKSVPAWWPACKLTDWLLGKNVTFDKSFLQVPDREIRDQVRMAAGTAAEGHLFTTEGLNLTHLRRYRDRLDEKKSDGKEEAFDKCFEKIGLSVRITSDDPNFAVDLKGLDTWHPLGGERRLVHWKEASSVVGWTCPDAIRKGLEDATRIRMMLATPAIFKDGWKPGWLNEGLKGVPPGSETKLELVGVSNGHWKAVSGWSLARVNGKGEPDPNGKPGPKAIRRMVPAGSVYFFKVDSGDPADLAGRCWMRSVSDDERERLDGFGLAVWGAW